MLENDQDAHQILANWLESCKRHRKISRNTVAVGIVILDRLLRICPVTEEDMFSSGGEVKGSRAGLGTLLQKYAIPATYLKEVTTRQAHQDGRRLLELLRWGYLFQGLSESEKEKILLDLVNELKAYAIDWLERQNLKLDINRRQSPAKWIQSILENAELRSGGIVEQHLVGAKLEKRYKNIQIPNYPAHAADVQTARSGDFSISKNVYHVTAAPGRSVIQKCASNARSGNHAILLVPQAQEYKAIALAEEDGISDELTIISIEDFIAINIIELATDNDTDFFSVLQDIVKIYNRRLVEVETDLSLQIEVS